MALHLVPEGDWWEHVTTPACWCRPRIEHVQRPDGRWGRLIVHWPADGRDPIEPPDDGTDSGTP